MRNEDIESVNMYFAHFMVQSTKQFLSRRFTRRTANIRVLKLKKRESEFIKFVKENQNIICDYLVGETELRNIPKFRDIIKSIKNFYDSHNCNVINNSDLFNEENHETL